MRGIIIDTTNHCILRDCEYDPNARIDGMYYKIGADMIPCAYVFPESNRASVESALIELKANKKRYDEENARIYYKVLPTLR